MFVTWHSYVFANRYGLLLLQAILPSLVIFEKPRKLFGHYVIHLLYLFVWEAIMFRFYL